MYISLVTMTLHINQDKMTAIGIYLHFTKIIYSQNQSKHNLFYCLFNCFTFRHARTYHTYTCSLLK